MTPSAREAAHRARLEPYVGPHLARRAAGVKHPVHDFLFTYYSFRPAQLLRWVPGTEPLPEKKRPLAEAIAGLLRATATREGNVGCFAMHEWAMVYRTPVNRHAMPLRLGGKGTDRVVESHRLRCSHFDACRFFTPDAIPLNTLHPGRDDRADFEQPACLHAGMDLYKHAFRLWPHVGSDLVAACFELAWELRNLDMQAAPYDLTGLILDPHGVAWTPILVETAEGKAEFAARQRDLAERAAPLRARLLAECDRLLGAPA